VPVFFRKPQMLTANKPQVRLEHRPLTQDGEVCQEIFRDNCYRLPERFSRLDTILDVGAHIGVFSLACLLRGAGRVFAFEPDAKNYALLETNLGHYIGARCFQAAIWRNDEAKTDFLEFSGYPPLATACGSCLPDCTVAGENDHIPVAAVGLDEAIMLASDCGLKAIRLLKIDAEGAEFPALYTSKKLDLVEEIVGECHELHGMFEALKVPGFTKFDMEELGGFLESQGFTVEVKQQKSKFMKYFFARRKNPRISA
jgi:FkbM family methyltransferase